MAGAQLTGEFAWAFESLLNRVLDGTRPADAAVFDALDRAAATLPGLIAQLKGEAGPQADVDGLRRWALAYAAGETDAPYADTAGAAAEAPEPDAIPEPTDEPTESASGAFTESEWSFSFEDFNFDETPDSAAEDAEGVDRSGVPTAVTPAYPPLSDDADPEVLDIFLEEAEEEIARIAEQLPRWREDPADDEALTTLRRSFHTLKGSGRMAGAQLTGEFAWAFESLLNRVLDGTRPADAAVFDALDRAAATLPGLIAQLKGEAGPQADVDGLRRWALAYAAGETHVPHTQWASATPAPSPGPVEGAPRHESSESSYNPLDLPLLRSGETPDYLSADADSEVLHIYIDEAREEQERLVHNLAVWRQTPDDTEVLLSLRRSYHTLRGSGRLVGAQRTGNFAWTFENLLNQVIEGNIPISEELFEPLGQANTALRELIEQLAGGPEPTSDVAGLMAWAERYARKPDSGGATTEPAAPAETSGLDPELVAIFQREAQSNLDTVAQILTETHDEAFQPSEGLRRCLHTLQGGASTVRLPRAAALAQRMENLVRRAQKAEIHLDTNAARTLRGGLDLLQHMIRALDDQAVAEEECDALEGRLEDLESALPTAKATSTHWGDRLGWDESNAWTANTAQGGPGYQTDREIAQLYLTEVDELLRTNEPTLDHWLHDLHNDAYLTELRRTIHSIKGGARMFGFERVTRLSIGVEQLIDTQENRPDGTDPTAYGELIRSSFNLLSELIQSLMGGADETRFADSVAQLENRIAGLVATGTAEGTSTHGGRSEEQTPAMPQDDELRGLFLDEAQEILDACDTTLNQWLGDTGNGELLTHMQRHFHTLKGGARMAGLGTMGELAQSLERLLATVSAESGLENDAGHLLREGLDQLYAFMEWVRTGQAENRGPNLIALQQRIDRYTAPPPEAEAVHVSHDETQSDELVGLFVEESEDLLRECETALDTWLRNVSDPDASHALQRHFHTLKGGARMAGFEKLGEAVHALENLLVAVAEQRLGTSDALFRILRSGLDTVSDAIDNLRQGVAPERVTLEALQQEITGFIERQGRRSVETAAVPESKDTPPDQQDPELVGMFLEEVSDLLESSERTLQRWRQQLDDLDAAKELQRYLHTIKGGSRMAGFYSIGDLSHAMENLLVRLADGVLEPSASLVELLQNAFDQLNQMFDEARNAQRVNLTAEIVGLQQALNAYPEGVGALTSSPEGEPSERSATASGSMPTATTQNEAKQPPSAVTEAGSSQSAAASRSAAPAEPATRAAQDLVRVRAESLDRLVNFAGEVNIYHSRLNQQVSSFRHNLQELDRTVTRIREQLRKLDIETESQILARHEREGRDYTAEGFDPLEMDRYSNLQQLSRAVNESVSDLSSIQGLMGDQLRDTETLLLQQSRVSTELQDGLMRTRMVQFSGLIPRLRRIVRQTSQSLNKRAELYFSGAESEVDRSLLDRLVGPLEHLLRNAVSHGIEVPSKRREGGKSEAGSVSVHVAREAGDVVVQVSDDGKGINLQSVRTKAEEKGMISPDTELSDREVMQLLLESGFSTAENVTQISGRGVGMDVVNNEVKVLGGSLKIDSQQSRGTTFTMRLPFTLAINEAVLIGVEGHSYAIPLGNVEGLVRLANGELKRLFDQENPHYEYAGNQYRCDYLGALFGTSQPSFEPEGNHRPVLMTRAGDQRVALLVDSVEGIQEIVVKPVGPQIGQVHGISGATILGDGRVILILEMGGLAHYAGDVQIRTEQESAEQKRAAVEDEKNTIMVVDDSITIRRVTARMLNRNGMEPLLAKDGMDAVNALQEKAPDLILLDIEMPRMDGFELASHVRNDPRLHSTPIIMISSRTGQKHQQRAFDIGVNRFLGKPYQESDLLRNINELLAEPTAAQ